MRPYGMYVLLPFPRIALALATGSAASALLWCIIFFIPAGHYDATMMLAWVIATLVWMVSSTVLGGPLWIMLHRRRFRGPLHAILLGLVLGFIVSLALNTNLFGLLSSADPAGTSSSVGDGRGLIESNGVLTAYGWQLALRSAVIIAICSATGGAITWRIAYRTTSSDAAG